MPTLDDPTLIRRADRDRLGAALAESRANTLRTFAACERSLRATSLEIPYSEQLNPPLWELGHVGWFQEYWIGRNQQRSLGVGADPQAPRSASRLTGADSLYDSSRVEHATRWHLPLPDAAATRDYLARTLDHTLQVLAHAGDHGLLYFAWLALMHEDMHHEASLYMANALGIPVDVGRPQAPEPSTVGDAKPVWFDAARVRIGSAYVDFAFDNELMARWVDVDRFGIDRAPVDNRAFAAFIEDGGYEDARHWTAAGWAWRQQSSAGWPRFWRPAAGGWQRCWFGEWSALDESAPVANLTLHEAQAWCRWAGRRLPTEIEWEVAANEQPASAGGAAPIVFGQVWEWTASEFEPYPGFAPHPYRDYSLPWFGTRQVLRGASFASHPRMRYSRYRNFFTPERNDIFAGFRSCAIAAGST
jgi:gamma-glutamyl hercynylcysteine S-oxide synthase